MTISVEYRLQDQTILGRAELNDLQAKALFKAHKLLIEGQHYRVISTIYKTINGEEIIVYVQAIL